MLRQIECGAQNGHITKNGVFILFVRVPFCGCLFLVSFPNSDPVSKSCEAFKSVLLDSIFGQLFFDIFNM